MCVSLTLHFQMSGKRPLLGPRRGPPFCNTSTTNQSFLDGGLHSGSFHHSLQALMDATKIKPTVLSWQSSSAGYTHDSALCTSKILLCRCSATLGAENRACVPSLSVRPDSLRPHGVYVAHQAPLSMGFSRQEYWRKWVAISSSRESSLPKDRTHVSCFSCIGRWILYHYQIFLHPLSQYFQTPLMKMI